MRNLILFAISTLTALPFLGFLATLLFEYWACEGGVMNLGDPYPDCIVFGINFETLYQVGSGITFFAFAFAPLTILWFIVGTYLFLRFKRTSP